MIKVSVLATGSSGNAAIISNGNTTILLDLGISYSKLVELSELALSKELNTINVKTGNRNRKEKTFNGLVDGVLVSHADIDHCACANRFQKINNSIPIFVTTDCWVDLNRRPFSKIKDYEAISFKEQFEIKDFVITPFRVEHDAIGNTGYVLYDKLSDKSIFWCTDMGNLDGVSIKGCDAYFIESNYDDDLLVADILDKKYKETHVAHLERKYDAHFSHSQCDEWLEQNNTNNGIEVRLHESGVHSQEKFIEEFPYVVEV